MQVVDKLRNFGFLVRDVSRLSAKRFERNAHGLELTLPQCKVLAHLSRNEGISQARLAELTETDPDDAGANPGSHAAGRLDRASSRSRSIAVPTACSCARRAKPMIDRIWKIAEQTRNEALSSLNQGEREHLIELLERIHGTLVALEVK